MVFGFISIKLLFQKTADTGTRSTVPKGLSFILSSVYSVKCPKFGMPTASPALALKADEVEALLVGFQKPFDFLPEVLEIPCIG